MAEYPTYLPDTRDVLHDKSKAAIAAMRAALADMALPPRRRLLEQAANQLEVALYADRTKDA